MSEQVFFFLVANYYHEKKRKEKKKKKKATSRRKVLVGICSGCNKCKCTFGPRRRRKKIHEKKKVAFQFHWHTASEMHFLIFSLSGSFRRWKGWSWQHSSYFYWTERETEREYHLIYLTICSLYSYIFLLQVTQRVQWTWQFVSEANHHMHTSKCMRSFVFFERKEEQGES